MGNPYRDPDTYRARGMAPWQAPAAPWWRLLGAWLRRPVGARWDARRLRRQRVGEALVRWGEAVQVTSILQDLDWIARERADLAADVTDMRHRLADLVRFGQWWNAEPRTIAQRAAR